jgi:protein TonB
MSRLVMALGIALLLRTVGAQETRDYDEPPRIAKQTKPIYPRQAYSDGIEGTVVIRFTIDEQGRVQAPAIVQSIPALDKAAIECVRQWRFHPAKKSGQVVVSKATAPITFRITSKPAEAGRRPTSG